MHLIRKLRVGKMRKAFIVLLFFLPRFALSQQITLSVQREKLQRVFERIEAQSDLRFIYSEEALASSQPVTFTLANGTIDSVLQLCFRHQPLQFTVSGKNVIVRRKVSPVIQKVSRVLTGRVINDQGEGLAGVTVQAKGSLLISSTDQNGDFVLKEIPENTVLMISGAEIESQEMNIGNRLRVSITVRPKVGMLTETLVMAYGETTRKLAVGNISKVKGSTISQQAINNPILALQGRVPGLVITQTSGYSGGAVSIQLRGQSSILQGSSPFFVIDGIPVATQNNSLNQLSNASSTNNSWSGGGISPFYLLNPEDIESVEVLKDAEATSIYGSRGANGVILITTKRGKKGKFELTTNISNAWSRVTRMMRMMNTTEYVAMRREAFSNDGIIPTETTAADILLWDTTRYTNFQQLLIGGTALTQQVQLSATGGNEQLQFWMSGAYNTESTVLPTEYRNRKLNGQAGFNYVSADKKIKTRFSAGYAYAKNQLPSIDAAALISTPPNLLLRDSLGNLNWQEKGIAFKDVGLGTQANPLATFSMVYTGQFKSLNTSVSIEYNPLSSLALRIQAGYNQTIGDEHRKTPLAGQDPFDANSSPQAFFGAMDQSTWIAEPQAEYTLKTKAGKFAMLAGATFQEQTSSGHSINAFNYSSDLLLESTRGAGSLSITNSYGKYKYAAVFGRLLYNYADRYLLSITGRRDGSSRFGPENQFATFGAIGGAWVFSSDQWVQQALPWLSFGKLRASYGHSGNDQIGDYTFMDTWTTTSAAYNGGSGLQPSALFNPNLAWEINKKFETGIEVGILQQRIDFSVVYYRNRSSNQLISYNLPIQTGFANIRRNLDALVENGGVEVTLSGVPVRTRQFSWQIQANFTSQSNKLLKFPNLQNSSYANSYVIGQPLSVARLYQYTGISADGLYTFLDADQNGNLSRADRVVYKNTQANFFGGIQQSFRYKKWDLGLFFQFVKQPGLNYLNTLSNFVPGTAYRNQPVVALNRWTKADDGAAVQRYTTQTTGSLNQASYLTLSDAAYSDASFIRFKNLSASYKLTLPGKHGMKRTEAQLYIHAQNVFTITSYLGGDPENQSIYRMPPLKTILIGLKMTL